MQGVADVNVLYRDEPFSYITPLMLDSDVPILVGRDIYGFPKRMGVIEFDEQDDILAGYVEGSRCSIPGTNCL